MLLLMLKNEVKGEIPNITNLASSAALTGVENKIPNVDNLVKKLTATQKLMKLKRGLLIMIITISILLLQNLISQQHKILLQDSNKPIYPAKLIFQNNLKKIDNKPKNFASKLNELSEKVKAISAK